MVICGSARMINIGDIEKGYILYSSLVLSWVAIRVFRCRHDIESFGHFSFHWWHHNLCKYRDCARACDCRSPGTQAYVSQGKRHMTRLTSSHVTIYYWTPTLISLSHCFPSRNENIHFCPLFKSKVVTSLKRLGRFY